MKRAAVFTLILIIAMAYTKVSAKEWGVLSIKLGKENEKNGIKEHSSGDGVTEPDEIEDKECRFVPKTPPNENKGNHIYFIVDPLDELPTDKSKTNELWIAVEFYDSAETATGIILQYDNEGDVYPDQAFALNVPQAPRTIEFTNTDEWKVAILHVEDAEFKEQGNSADFRFHIVDYMTEGFYVHKVWVSDHELTPEEVGASEAVSSHGKIASLWGELKQAGESISIINR